MQSSKGKYTSRINNNNKHGSHQSFRYSENFFAQLLDSIEDYAVFTTDNDGNISSWNAGAEKVLGYTEDEVIGKNIAIFFTPEDLENGRHLEELEIALKRGKAIDERFHTRKDGTVFWCSGFVFPLKDNSGEVRGFTKIMRNIDEKRKSAEELKMRSSVLENMVEGVSLSNKEGIIIYTNPSEDRMFGYERGELIGKPVTIQNAYPPEVNRKIVNSVIKDLQKKGFWEGEFDNVKKDGTFFTTFARITSIELSGKIHWMCVQEDITERKRITKDIQIQKKQFETVVNNTPDLIARFDKKFRHLFINSAVEKVTGMEAEAFLGKTLKELGASGNIYKKWREALSKVFKLGEEETVEYSFNTPIGERFFEARIVPETNGEGKVETVLVISRDITERILTNRNLNYLAEVSKVLSTSLDYNTTFQNIAKLAISHIADWCTIDIVDNDGELKQLAVVHKDPKMVKFAKKYREDNPPDMSGKTGLMKVIKTGKPEFIPYVSEDMLKASTNDKEKLKILRMLGFTSVMMVPLKTHGRNIGVITFISTELKRRYTELDLNMAKELASRASVAIDNAVLYQAVEREREKFKALFDSNIIGVFFAQKNKQITDANDAFLKIIGYTRKELEAGKIRWDKITPIEYKDKDEKAVKTLLKRGAAVPWEKEFIKKDGSQVPIVIGVALLSGITQDNVAFVLDISERKKLEQRKDEFIGIASHELKTPLTSIKGYTQILERIVEEIGDDRAKNLLSKTNIYIDRLNSLISDLLDVSKIQAGKLKFNMTEFRLNDLVKESIESIQPTSTKHIITCQKCPNLNIYGDKNRLEQVFMNLLSNAIKYSPRANKIDVMIEKEKDHAIISVKDYGVGIPKELQTKIFQRFYRVEKTASQFSGLGIGLYISSEIVLRHGGKIGVESEEGIGSTFYFTLPIMDNK